VITKQKLRPPYRKLYNNDFSKTTSKGFVVEQSKNPSPSGGTAQDDQITKMTSQRHDEIRISNERPSLSPVKIQNLRIDLTDLSKREDKRSKDQSDEFISIRNTLTNNFEIGGGSQRHTHNKKMFKTT